MTRWRCAVADYDIDQSGEPDEWGHFDATTPEEAAGLAVAEWDRETAETYPVACGEQVVEVLVEALDGTGRQLFTVSGERVPRYTVRAAR